MTKQQDYPESRVCHPEPPLESDEWLIWAAWADRVTFEQIYEQRGLSEAEVIKKMRGLLKPKTFKRWRRRVRHQSLKHRKAFKIKRQGERTWSIDSEFDDSILEGGDL